MAVLVTTETNIPYAMRHKHQIGREQAKIQGREALPQLRYSPEFFLDDRCYFREHMNGL